MKDVNTLWAFIAGIFSFISPCVLPVLPAFLATITGMSTMKKKWAHSFSFLLGFSVIFLALGFATSWFGSLFREYQNVIRIVGGVLTIFFGMVVAGIFQPKFLMVERRRFWTDRPSGLVGTFLIGLAFAAGWSPCMGPILAGVLAMTVTNPTMGVVNMIAYVIGFAIPFLLCMVFVGKGSFLKKHMAHIQVVGGYVMILMGFLLLMDWLSKISELLSKWTGGFTGF